MKKLDKNEAASPQDDLMRVIGAATDALSDQMVERMATTVGNALEIADQLNDEDTRAAISYTLERLTQLHRIGAIETLFGLLEAIHCGRMAMTDPMINRLLGFAEHMVSNLGNEEMATMVGTAFNALQEAVDETKNNPPSGGGVFSTVSMLSKPETQQALQFLLTTTSKMKQHFADEEK
ncbi:MAG: hypothetical protein HQL68_00985 [Magnetococcales bacterium]|nr:hypothetical protein [Magnetococcales bacterium]